jgi:menaquinone-dependent protoporphyrinogen IX oxidase
VTSPGVALRVLVISAVDPSTSAEGGRAPLLARRLVEALRDCGAEVDVRATSVAPDLSGYDGVVVVSSVRMQRHRPELVRVVTDCATGLCSRPSALLQVTEGPGTQGIYASAPHAVARELEDRTGWAPDVVALLPRPVEYRPYGWRRVRRPLGPGTAADLALLDQFVTDWLTDCAGRRQPRPSPFAEQRPAAPLVASGGQGVRS